MCHKEIWNTLAVADLRGSARDVRPRVQILLISCSFGGNLAKSYIGAPWRVGAATSGNPGSATV